MLLVFLGLSLRLLLINQEISVVLNKLLADDAFYYYMLAKNMVYGQGVVFNEGVITNGFHPLYALILLPVFSLLYPLGENVPIYASLYILTLFSVATSILLYLITGKLVNKNAGLLAAFIWLFNPYILFVSLLGLETPIQIFLISLLTYYLLSRESKTDFTFRESMVIGLLIGLVFLSRMDGLSIAVGVGVSLILRKLLHERSGKSFNINQLLKPDLVVISVVAFLTVLPWVSWTLLEAGRLTPVSGDALRIMRLNAYENLPYYRKALVGVFNTGTYTAKFFMCSIKNTTQGSYFVAVALFLPILILLLRKDDLIKKLLKSLDFLVIGSIVYYSFYWFYQFGLREWYSLYTLFLLTIVFSTTIIKIITEIKSEKLKKITYSLLIFFLVSTYVTGGVIRYVGGSYPQLELNWRAAKYISMEIPENVILGSFNTGAFQYYTKDHEVINLDGVMNSLSYHARKKNRMEEYILEKNISYIIDSAVELEFVNRSILTLQPVETFEMQAYSYKKGDRIVSYTLFKVGGNKTL